MEDKDLRRVAIGYQQEGSELAEFAQDLLGDLLVPVGEDGNYEMQDAARVAADIEENGWKRSMGVFFSQEDVARASKLTGRR